MYWTNVDDMSSQPSVATRVRNWWIDFPCFTRVLFLTCIGVYVLQLCGVLNTYTFCFQPSSTLYDYQVYRIFTSAYLHSTKTVLHIIFNELALVSLGPSLERSCGTAALVALTVFFQLVSGVCNVLLSYLAWKTAVSAFTSVFPFGSCAVGLSGVLFAYLTMEIYVYDVISSRSLFGLCTIPSKAYPFVLLLVIQLLWQGASLSGHLCGILAGLAGSYLVKDRFRALDGYVPAAVRGWRCYKAGEGLPVPAYSAAATASYTPPAFMNLRSWNPVSVTHAPTTQFPGQGRVLSTGQPPPQSQSSLV